MISLADILQINRSYNLSIQFSCYVFSTLRSVVSPDNVFWYEGRETTASNRLLFHRACASTWCLRQKVKWHHFLLFRRKHWGLKYPTTRRQRERSQNNRFNISKTTTLHVHHAFLCFSLPFSNDYHVKMPNFAILSLGIQLQLGSPTFGKVSR